MKQPAEFNDGNILKYEKSLFTKKEVLNEKKNMGTPDAWNLGEDKNNYYLEFSESSYDIIHKSKCKKILSTAETGRF